MANPKLTTLPNSASVEEACDVLERDGGVIIEDFVDTATLEGIWTDIGPDLDRQAFGEGEFVGSRTRRVSSLFARTMHSATIARQPHYIGAARYFLQRPTPIWLGDEQMEVTPTIQVGVAQAIQIWPGEGGQALHRDDGSHLRRHPGPESRVQVMVAASEFTAENGGTRVIPRSHLWDDDRGPKKEEAVPTEMPKGAGLIFLGSTYHAGGQNTSDVPRTGLTYTYDLGNLRQEENQYLAVPLDVVKKYPEDVQRLLGYELCPPFCGFYEMNDPLVLLRDDTDDLTARDMHLAKY